jgi:hypothetical protein
LSKVCTVCGVEEKIRSNGLCVVHYLADWREKNKAIPCKVEGCTKGCHARMMCETHYRHYISKRKSKDAREDYARAVADEEKRRIISLLEKFGHSNAAKLVSMSARKQVNK